MSASVTFTKFYRAFPLDANRKKSMKIPILPDTQARPMYFLRFLDGNIRANCPANRMLILLRKRFVTVKLTKSNKRDYWSASPQPSQNRFVTQRIFRSNWTIELFYLLIFCFLFFRPEQNIDSKSLLISQN